jgi:hypothetical protein
MSIVSPVFASGWKSRRAKPVEATGPDEKLSSGTFSPDDRRLPFSSDRQ